MMNEGEDDFSDFDVNPELVRWKIRDDCLHRLKIDFPPKDVEGESQRKVLARNKNKREKISTVNLKQFSTSSAMLVDISADPVHQLSIVLSQDSIAKPLELGNSISADKTFDSSDFRGNPQ